MRASALIERYRMALEVIADGPGYEFGPKVAKIALTDPWAPDPQVFTSAVCDDGQHGLCLLPGCTCGCHTQRPSVREAVEQARAEEAEPVCPCGEPSPPEFPPCTPEQPCSYGKGKPRDRWPEAPAPEEEPEPEPIAEPDPDPDLPGTDGLSPLSMTILHTVRQHAEMTAVDLKEWLPDDVSDQRRKKAIVALTERGLVVAEGSTKGRTYRAVVAPEVSQDKPTMPEEPASEPVADAGRTDGYTAAGMPIETAEVKRNGVGSDEGRLLESVRFKPNWSITQHAARLDLHQDRVSRAMRKLEEEGEVRSSPHGGRVVWNVR